MARLLFPQSHEIQHYGQYRCTLEHLYQALVSKALKQCRKTQAGGHSSYQQHDVKQCHNPRSRFFAGQISRQCQACSLGGVHTGADQDKGQHRSDWAGERGTTVRFCHDDKGKWHDGQSAKLQQRAHPQVRNPAPTKVRPVKIRAEAHQRPRWRKQQWDCHHQRHRPGRLAQFDHHDSIQRSSKQYRSHAYRDLEQGQSQQAG